MIKISGYSMIRKDRHGRNNNWGDVMIYHKNNIDLYNSKFRTTTGLKESLWVEVNAKSQKLLIGSFY